MNAMKSDIVNVEAVEVVEVVYNLIEIRNRITNEKFYAVRKESIESYWKRVIRDANNPNYPTYLTASVRLHGEENFAKKIVGEYSSRAAANADRFSMTVRNAVSENGTLNMNLPRVGVPESLDILSQNVIRKLDGVAETTADVHIIRGAFERNAEAE